MMAGSKPSPPTQSAEVRSEVRPLSPTRQPAQAGDQGCRRLRPRGLRLRTAMGPRPRCSGRQPAHRDRWWRMKSTTREVDCPRCHQVCGWCSDYRFMHGTLPLPGSRRRCTMLGMEPEGDGCPLCGGARRVLATTTFQAIANASPALPERRDMGSPSPAPDAGAEPGTDP